MAIVPGSYQQLHAACHTSLCSPLSRQGGPTLRGVESDTFSCFGACGSVSDRSTCHGHCLFPLLSGPAGQCCAHPTSPTWMTHPADLAQAPNPCWPGLRVRPQGQQENSGMVVDAWAPRVAHSLPGCLPHTPYLRSHPQCPEGILTPG